MYRLGTQGEDKLLAVKKLDLAYERFGYSFRASLLVSLLAVFALWPVVPGTTLLTWLIAMWTILSARSYYARRYLRLGDRASADLDKWTAGYVIGSVAAGLCWGVTVFCFPESFLDPAFFLLVFVLAGVTTFASVSMATLPSAAVAFTLASLLPEAIWLFSFNERLQIAMGAMVLAYMGLYLLFSRLIHNTVMSSLVLAEQNKELSSEVTRRDQHMQHYFENAPGCYFTLHRTRDGIFSMPFASNGIESIFGFGADMVANSIELLLALVHPDDIDRVLGALDHSARRMAPCKGEFRIGYQTKGESWIAMQCTPQKVERGVVQWHGVMIDISERKRMEEALAARESEFRSLAENAPDPIFRYDRDCRRIFVNSAVERLTGKPVLELLGKSPIEFVPNPSLEAVNAQRTIQQVLDTGEPSEQEVQFVAADGREVVVHNMLVPEFGADGSVQTVLCIGRDITERKRMEQELLESEDKHRTVFESANDGIFLHRIVERDGETEFILHDLNQKGCELWGYTREDILAGNFDLLAMNNPPYCFEEATRRNLLAAAGEPQLFDWELKRGDGSKIWGEVSLRRIQIGSEAFLLAVMRDLSERKLAEEALREREAFLDSLFTAIPIPVFYKDCEGHYLGYNRACEELMGVTGKQLVGKSVFDIHPRELAEIYHAKDLEIIEGRGVLQYESKVMDGNGALRDVLFSKAAFCDAQGRVKGLIGALLDITERKTSEQALRNSEAFLRSMLDAIPIPVFYKDKEGRYLGCNKSYETFTGVTREKVIGKTIFDFTPREVAEVYLAKDNDLYVQGGTQGYEFKLRNAQGELRDAIVSKALFSDSRGEVLGLIGAAIDITERKRMEDELAAREHESRTLVENTPDTIARYNRDCICTLANHALANSIDGGVDALLGKKPSEVPGGPQTETYEAKLREVFATGKNTEFELNWSDKNGHDICSHIRLAPEFDASGKVATVLAVGRDITELNAIRQKIHKMAFYDTLTSLPNRALFNDRLRQMMADAEWHGQQAGVMLLDLDRFKTVNDTLGHPAGDSLLCEAAARLSRCLRGYDTVARLGGDEFAILLPEIRSGDDLGRVAQKILVAFNEPFMLEGKEVFISTSIGIAVYPDDSTSADDLIKQSDSAMYFAKRSGRNNFRFYSKELTVSASGRLMLESELRRAVERNELELYYQPKVRLTDYRLCGSEALLRWKNPERGMVPPDQFIPIAEDSGLIVEIGEWVLREACRTACEWNGPGKPLHQVAVNMSARQFQSGDLVEMVSRVLAETACCPEWIELEITESLLLDEQGDVLEMLNSFRSIGISIAIDDFGTGYSALSYLARFPITTLKIDRSFINTITTEKYRAELVKAIISIAHSLGQHVVAEGVETPEQAAFLQAHGCHTAQGYLFSKPAAKTAFELLPQTFSDCREVVC